MIVTIKAPEVLDFPNMIIFSNIYNDYKAFNVTDII